MDCDSRYYVHMLHRWVGHDMLTMVSVCVGVCARVLHPAWENIV
jgi:hypothetical protein